MATITISNLPEVSTILDYTNIPIETVGITQRISGANLKTYLASLPTLTATSGNVSGQFNAGSLFVASTANIANNLTAGSITAGDGTFVNLSTNTLAVAGASTFSGNVSATNFIASAGVFASTVTGTLQTALQPKITQVGTITSGTWSGSFGAVSGANLTSITGANVTGTVANAATAVNATQLGGLPASSYLASGAGAFAPGGTIEVGQYMDFHNGTTALTDYDVRFNVSGTGVTGAGTLTVTGALTVTGLITGTATSAQYADLAEKYLADADYEPGTVMIFGVDTETTISRVANDRRVAGVVSTNPAYLMNSESSGVAIALQGRVPCRVAGKIARGDLLVASNLAGVAMANNDPKPGTVIGKALANYDSDMIGIIEVVVGRV